MPVFSTTESGNVNLYLRVSSSANALFRLALQLGHTILEYLEIVSCFEVLVIYIFIETHCTLYPCIQILLKNSKDYYSLISQAYSFSKSHWFVCLTVDFQHNTGLVFIMIVCLSRVYYEQVVKGIFYKVQKLLE
jgi:hypothetical protein